MRTNWKITFKRSQGKSCKQQGKKEVSRIIGQTGKTEIYSAIKKGI